MLVSICLSSALPDLCRPPLIEEEKHFILTKVVQCIQQQLELFVVTRIRAGKHPLRFSPSETSAPQHAWLTRAVIVGLGERYPDKVVIRFWELL